MIHILAVASKAISHKIQLPKYKNKTYNKFLKKCLYGDLKILIMMIKLYFC